MVITIDTTRLTIYICNTIVNTALFVVSRTWLLQWSLQAGLSEAYALSLQGNVRLTYQPRKSPACQ